MMLIYGYEKKAVNTMTVVECFDKDPINNILSLTALSPSHIIFLSSTPIPLPIRKRYEQLAKESENNCTVTFTVTDTGAVPALISAIERIIETHDNVAFDLTGGGETMLAAVGMIYERYRYDKHLRLHRFDKHTGEAFDAVDNTPLKCQAPALTVAQMIALYGGAVGGRTNGGTPTVWTFDDTLKQTLNVLWRINKDAPSAYNKVISQLREFEKYRHASSPLRTCVYDHYATERIDRFREKRESVTAFLKKLSDNHLVEIHSLNGMLDFTYRDAQTKACLSKAGNLLELKTLAAATQLKDENGDELITDALCGVHIDWDGDFSDVAEDTLNEIDVLLTKGVTPVFISCKNGTMDDKELYKLSTVARRFGGNCATAAVVATYIDKNPLVRTALLQRAHDMNIAVIADVHLLSDDAFQEQLNDVLERRSCTSF